MNYLNVSSKNINDHAPAHYIIVDVGIPTPAHTTETLLTSIQNVICLGSNQVPVVGVALINATFQQVISMSSTRSQLARILHSLKTVTDTGKCRARILMEEFKDYIHIGIQKVIEDFQSLPQRLKEGDYCPTEIQIIIFSMKNGFEIKYHVEQLIKIFPSDQLKKIQVVELIEDYLEPESRKNAVSCTANLIEYVQVPSSSNELEQLLKRWLITQDTLQEDVQVMMQDIIIFCDIQQCFLLRNTANASDKSSQIHGEGNSVLQLEVTHRLSSDGLCETQLFGDPVALVPSQCRHFSWPRRQLNQQYFSALTEKVMSGDEYLVAKCTIRGQPLHYFVLMPGEGMLLVKGLVTAEMALPSKEIQYLQTTAEVDYNVTSALVALPTLQSYRTSDFSTGLYNHLLQAAIQSAKKPQKHEPLCKDPSHESIVVGIEIKKTMKRKKQSKSKLKKNPRNDLPQLTDSDQQTITELLKRNQKKKILKS